MIFAGGFSALPQRYGERLRIPGRIRPRDHDVRACGISQPSAEVDEDRIPTLDIAEVPVVFHLKSNAVRDKLHEFSAHASLVRYSPTLRTQLLYKPRNARRILSGRACVPHFECSCGARTGLRSLLGRLRSLSGICPSFRRRIRRLFSRRASIDHRDHCDDRGGSRNNHAQAGKERRAIHASNSSGASHSTSIGLSSRPKCFPTSRIDGQCPRAQRSFRRRIFGLGSTRLADQETICSGQAFRLRVTDPKETRISLVRQRAARRRECFPPAPPEGPRFLSLSRGLVRQAQYSARQARSTRPGVRDP